MEESTYIKKYMDLFCIEQKPGPSALVIFGASGELSQQRLIPSLFELYRKMLLPKHFYIIGFSRTFMNTETFRERVAAAVVKNISDAEKAEIKKFQNLCYYKLGNYAYADDFEELGKYVEELDEKYQTGGNHIFYLAVPPDVICPIVGNLKSSGFISNSGSGDPFTRVIFEKPFGHDLESAKSLSDEIEKSLAEEQIYRIDHYLGKETVQNILMFRFANAVFEPVWNSSYVDHVQITAAESVGVGFRAGYYENVGQFRDMFQNHMMQLLAIVAMEEPASFSAEDVRDRKAEFMKSIRPFPELDLEKWIVRGQYIKGRIKKNDVVGYREEPGIPFDSCTETYVAAKFMIDNERWKGVPFYLRSGKRLPRKVTEISVVFKPVERKLFSDMDSVKLAPNILTFNVQPEEGISLVIQAKHPGPKLCMSSLTMDFCYKEVFGAAPPEAYQRLILDCMLGDQTLFVRKDSMEEAWKLITPVQERWQNDPDTIPLHLYTAGSGGPSEGNKIISEDGREWIISKRGCG